jgi:hypothetical protein
VSRADDLAIWTAVDRLSVAWGVHSHRKVRAMLRPVVRERRCRTCGAAVDVACVTVSGAEARIEHTSRWADWARAEVKS